MKKNNILILNWRDPKNPKSGGAEKLNIQVLKPFLDRGDSVTWYTTAVKNLPSREYYEGIAIFRVGNPLTHLLQWPLLYWTGKLGNPDLIIDCIHGTGYLASIITPKKKKIILICEVAQNIWDEMYPFPINSMGKIWEKIMFRFYGNNKFWTISESTKKDLTSFGVPNKNIRVLPMGFDRDTQLKKYTKYSEPTALFVGRLAEMKGIKDALLALATINKKDGIQWKLKIIGRGDSLFEAELKKIINDLAIQKYVTFLGFVREQKKFEEMARAWVLLVPSSREGWGMIVPEANSVGTIALGYDVAGLSEVLKKYSSQNIVVKKGYKNLATQWEKIRKPVRLKQKITPGWHDLYTFVNEYSIK